MILPKGGKVGRCQFFISKNPACVAGFFYEKIFKIFLAEIKNSSIFALLFRQNGGEGIKEESSSRDFVKSRGFNFFFTLM